jgi:predicted ATPase
MAVWSDGAAGTPGTPPLPDLLPSPRHSRRLGEVVPGVLAMSAARRQDAIVSSFLQTLSDSLSSRALVLVWDNCDYLVDGCRALAQALLAACPQVKILATSRRSLHFPGKILHTVPPFRVPEAGLAAPRGGARAIGVMASDALQSFQQRARGPRDGR